MEIKFNRTTLTYMDSVIRQPALQEQTQQVRIPDSMPDIDVVLSIWGYVSLRSKEWHADNIQVSGGTTVKVLYLTKEKKPECIEAWLPFQIGVEIPDTQRDGTVTVRPFLRNAEAKALSDRKLSIRATVGLSIDARVQCECQLYTPEIPTEGVQLLHNAYMLQLPVEVGEKSFAVEEPLKLHSEGTDITILRQSLEMVATECKIIADKLVFRGSAVLDILYMDESGELYRWNRDVSVSQYAQLTGEYDSNATADICFAVTELELERTEDTGYIIKAGILAQFTICDSKDISVAEDAYIPNRMIEITTETLELPSVLSVNEQTVQAEADFTMPENRILDVFVLMEELQPEFDDNTLYIRPAGTFQVLSQDGEGNYYCTSHRWECTWQLNTSPDIEADISAIFEGMPEVNGSKITVPLRLKLISTNGRTNPMISAIELGDSVAPDPNRPSIILQRLGGDTLWQLAKRTGATVEAIMKANDIQQEPNSEKLLLIPLN